MFFVLSIKYGYTAQSIDYKNIFQNEVASNKHSELVETGNLYNEMIISQERYLEKQDYRLPLIFIDKTVRWIRTSVSYAIKHPTETILIGLSSQLEIVKAQDQEQINNWLPTETMRGLVWTTALAIGGGAILGSTYYYYKEHWARKEQQKLYENYLKKNFNSKELEVICHPELQKTIKQESILIGQKPEIEEKKPIPGLKKPSKKPKVGDIVTIKPRDIRSSNRQSSEKVVEQYLKEKKEFKLRFEERITNHDDTVKNIYLTGYTDPHVTTNEKNNDCHVSILFLRDNYGKLKIINNWYEEEKKIGKYEMINQTGTIMFYFSLDKKEIKDPYKIRIKQSKRIVLLNKDISKNEKTPEELETLKKLSKEFLKSYIESNPVKAKYIADEIGKKTITIELDGWK